MSMPKLSDRDKEDAPLPAETLNVLIARHVIQALGPPTEMLKVKVHPLGGDRYRVNVLVGQTITTARIAHSYFLTADGSGHIVNCSPKIVRLYGADRELR